MQECNAAAMHVEPGKLKFSHFCLATDGRLGGGLD